MQLQTFGDVTEGGPEVLPYGLVELLPDYNGAIRGESWAMVDSWLLTFGAKGEEKLVGQGMKMLHIFIDVDQVHLRIRDLAEEARVLGHSDEVDAKELIGFEDIVKCFLSGIDSLVEICLGIESSTGDHLTYLEKISNCSPDIRHHLLSFWKPKVNKCLFEVDHVVTEQLQSIHVYNLLGTSSLRLDGDKVPRHVIEPGRGK